MNDLKDRIFKSPIWVKALIVVIIVAIGWFTIPKLLGTQSNSATQYQTAQVTKGTIIVTVSSSGQVSSANSGSVTTQASGVVTKILVQNGQTVKTGQPIAEFDLDQTSKQKYASAMAAYQGAKNSVASAQADAYSLQSSMFVANQKFMNGVIAAGTASYDPTYVEQNADWLASQQKYITQQSVIAQAQTSLNSAALALQQVSTTVTSPISGTVTGLSLQVGSVLTSASDANGNSTAQKIASIKTAAEPTVSVNLTQVDVPNVKVGDKATLTFDSFPDETFTGSVVSIDTIGAVTSGVTTYPAVIKLDSASDSILSNMTATANIITDSKDDVLLVPSAAVQTSTAGDSSVRVLKNGQVTSVPVTIGLSSSTQVEVDSGLAEGDTVVTGTTAPATTTTGATTSTSPFSGLTGGNRGFGGAGGAGAAVRTTRGG